MFLQHQFTKMKFTGLNFRRQIIRGKTDKFSAAVLLIAGQILSAVENFILIELLMTVIRQA